MADERDVRHQVALAVGRYLHAATYDETAAHAVASTELGSWLGALIDLHLRQEPSWLDH